MLQPNKSAAATGESAGAAADDGKSDEWKPGASQPIQIDLDGLMSRAVLLPVPAADIAGLDVRRGHVFYFTTPIHTIEGKLPGENEALHVFDLKERKDATVVDSLDSYRLSANGQKVLYKKDKDWFIVDALPPKDGGQDKGEKKTLNLSHLRELVDPRQEWHEMYDSAWRLERDFFYSSKMNGVDWNAIHDAYAKFLPLLGSREDLTYLLGEMVGELSNSHTYVGGGDRDDPTDKVRTGLLGRGLWPRYGVRAVFLRANLSRRQYARSLSIAADATGIESGAGEFPVGRRWARVESPHRP
jgi:tricorn protease